MKKVSVIVPIYNVEDYLKCCVDSIVNQTYKNLEIILVDDGSPDNCGKMCDDFAKQDDRIKVIHKENGGLSDARNAGLDVASGDLIAFVDSDDYIDLNMVEVLVEALEKNDADISMCRYSKVYPDVETEDIGDNTESVFLKTDGLKEYLLARFVDPFVWNKLYRKEIIDNIRFVKGVLGEDNEFNYKVFLNSEKSVLIQKPLYKYRQERPGAITESSYISEKKIHSIYNWDKIHNDCKVNAPQLEMYVIRRRAYFYIGAYNKIILHKSQEYEADKKNIRLFLKEYKKQILKSDICDKKLKISVMLLCVCPPFYSVVMKVFKKIAGDQSL